MATEFDQARSLAERIARKVSTTAPAPPPGSLTSEIASVRESISELQKRLAQLESRARAEASSPAQGSRPAQQFVPSTHSPWLAGVNAPPVSHVSEERFGVEEAVINELVDYFQNEKPCSLDPSGKPCDHCAMCSSRGF